MLSIQWIPGASAALMSVLVSAPFLQAADEPDKGNAPAVVPALKLPLARETAEPEITLSVGKPAPAFVVGAWVKGEPLESLKAGQVYVVEFWATWCGPCLAGMPHISKLQTEYGEKVRIIGISREEESVVREFLTKDREEGVTWDQTVTYSLAMDAENKMNTTWFRAAGRTGIPSAFLVGKDGIIEWIGHPAAIDEPLAKVVDGTWDRAAAIKAYEVELKEMKAAAEARKFQIALTKAMIEKDWKRALEIVDEWSTLTPDSPSPRLARLAVLSQSGQSEEAAAFLKQTVEADWDKGQLLTTLAVGIAQARFPGTLDEAERIARRSVELSHEKGLSQLHALARVYAEKGQLKDAIAWEKKALELAPENRVIRQTLQQFEEKLAEAAPAPEPGSK
jgi:thiol-disulfide isomerase/thioredoxin